MADDQPEHPPNVVDEDAEAAEHQSAGEQKLKVKNPTGKPETAKANGILTPNEKPKGDDVTPGNTCGSSGANRWEERLRLTREKQMENLRRKADGLKESELRAEECRKKADDERKRRMDELRRREEQHRVVVEERRRKMLEDENEKRLALMRKTMEREVKLDHQKHKINGDIKLLNGSKSPKQLAQSQQCNLQQSQQQQQQIKRPHSVAGRPPSYASPTVASTTRMTRSSEKDGEHHHQRRPGSAPPDFRSKFLEQQQASNGQNRSSHPVFSVTVPAVEFFSARSSVSNGKDAKQVNGKFDHVKPSIILRPSETLSSKPPLPTISASSKGVQQRPRPKRPVSALESTRENTVTMLDVRNLKNLQMQKQTSSASPPSSVDSKKKLRNQFDLSLDLKKDHLSDLPGDDAKPKRKEVAQYKKRSHSAVPDRKKTSDRDIGKSVFVAESTIGFAATTLFPSAKVPVALGAKQQSKVHKDMTNRLESKTRKLPAPPSADLKKRLEEKSQKITNDKMKERGTSKPSFLPPKNKLPPALLFEIKKPIPRPAKVQDQDGTNVENMEEEERGIVENRVELNKVEEKKIEGTKVGEEKFEEKKLGEKRVREKKVDKKNDETKMVEKKVREKKVEEKKEVKTPVKEIIKEGGFETKKVIDKDKIKDKKAKDPTKTNTISQEFDLKTKDAEVKVKSTKKDDKDKALPKTDKTKETVAEEGEVGKVDKSDEEIVKDFDHQGEDDTDAEKVEPKDAQNVEQVDQQVEQLPEKPEDVKQKDEVPSKTETVKVEAKVTEREQQISQKEKERQEKLKKDEEERLNRKKRVDLIMKRVKPDELSRSSSSEKEPAKLTGEVEQSEKEGDAAGKEAKPGEEKIVEQADNQTEKTDSQTGEVPIERTISQSEENMVEKTDSQTKDVPVEKIDSQIGERLVEKTDSQTEERVVDVTDSQTEERVVKETDSLTGERLVERTDSQAEEVSPEKKDSQTEEASAVEAQEPSEEEIGETDGSKIEKSSFFDMLTLKLKKALSPSDKKGFPKGDPAAIQELSGLFLQTVLEKQREDPQSRNAAQEEAAAHPTEIIQERRESTGFGFFGRISRKQSKDIIEEKVVKSDDNSSPKDSTSPSGANHEKRKSITEAAFNMFGMMTSKQRQTSKELETTPEENPLKSLVESEKKINEKNEEIVEKNSELNIAEQTTSKDKPSKDANQDQQNVDVEMSVIKDGSTKLDADTEENISQVASEFVPGSDKGDYDIKKLEEKEKVEKGSRIEDNDEMDGMDDVCRPSARSSISEGVIMAPLQLTSSQLTAPEEKLKGKTSPEIVCEVKKDESHIAEEKPVAEKDALVTEKTAKDEPLSQLEKHTAAVEKGVNPVAEKEPKVYSNKPIDSTDDSTIIKTSTKQAIADVKAPEMINITSPEMINIVVQKRDEDISTNLSNLDSNPSGSTSSLDIVKSEDSSFGDILMSDESPTELKGQQEKTESGTAEVPKPNFDISQGAQGKEEAPADAGTLFGESNIVPG